MNPYSPATSKNTSPPSSPSTTNRLLSHPPHSSYYSVSSSNSSTISSIETPQHLSVLSTLMQSISQPTAGISTQLKQTDSNVAGIDTPTTQSLPTLDPNFLRFLDKGPPEKTTEVSARSFGEGNTKDISPPRLNLKHMSTDLTTSVFSRLSYVLGENTESLSEEHSDTSQPIVNEEHISNSHGIIRVERDYSLGELCRFSLTYPPELSDKVTPESFQRSITQLNDILHKAETSWARNSIDNIISCLTLYTSPLCFGTFYQKCMKELNQVIAKENDKLYIPAGLHLRDPRRTGFLFLEIEVLEQQERYE